MSGMLDPEMIEDTAKILNEATKDKAQVNLDAQFLFLYIKPTPKRVLINDPRDYDN